MCFNKTPLTTLPLKLASLPIKLLINLRNVPALHFALTVMNPSTLELPQAFQNEPFLSSLSSYGKLGRYLRSASVSRVILQTQ